MSLGVKSNYKSEKTQVVDKRPELCPQVYGYLGLFIWSQFFLLASFCGRLIDCYLMDMATGRISLVWERA